MYILYYINQDNTFLINTTKQWKAANNSRAPKTDYKQILLGGQMLPTKS